MLNATKKFVDTMRNGLLYSSTWQFRWITQRDGIGRGEKNTWAIKDVYIGRMCPSHCHGHGDCIRGRCYCDNGYRGFRY